MSHFVAQRVEHEGSFLVDAAPAVAFDLFTPEGEREWVGPAWDPLHLYPASGTLEVGAVFRTREADGTPTFWMNLACDRPGGHLEYVRLTPDSRLGTVTVRLSAEDGSRSRVDVRYRFTSTSAAGNDYLTAFDAESYDRMLRDWRDKIAAALAARSGRHGA